MTHIDSDLEVLLILGSPQLDGLAPELTGFRDELEKISLPLDTASCTGCAKRGIRRRLGALAARVSDTIKASPQLQGVVDALMTTAIQAEEARDADTP